MSKWVKNVASEEADGSGRGGEREADSEKGSEFTEWSGVWLSERLSNRVMPGLHIAAVDRCHIGPLDNGISL